MPWLEITYDSTTARLQIASIQDRFAGYCKNDSVNQNKCFKIILNNAV